MSVVAPWSCILCRWGADTGVSGAQVMSVMTDDLLRFRDEFPILATSTDLLSNSRGAMPLTVPDRLADVLVLLSLV